LHELEYDNKKAINKPFLSQKSKNIRYVWGLTKMNYNWNNVVFSDETSIWLNFNCKRWIHKNDDKYHHTVKHPMKLHVWGYISKKYGSGIFIFKENLNGVLYSNILNDHIVDANDKNMIFQDDNDPKHRSILVTNWKKNKNISSLDWPSYSPDLNPIENIWAILKMKLRRCEIRTIDEFENSIKKCWNDISQNIIDNTISSMDNRIKELIEKHGDVINY